MLFLQSNAQLRVSVALCIHTEISQDSWEQGGLVEVAGVFVALENFNCQPTAILPLQLLSYLWPELIAVYLSLSNCISSSQGCTYFVFNPTLTATGSSGAPKNTRKMCGGVSSK